ncbi:hypothetical protein, partial [Anaerotignum faecicola]
THCETGSKFLLLFSIKSKGGMLCFAEKVPNGRTANVGEPFYFCASAPNQCEALVLFCQWFALPDRHLYCRISILRVPILPVCIQL